MLLGHSHRSLLQTGRRSTAHVFPTGASHYRRLFALPAGCIGGSHCWCSGAGSAGNRTWNFEYKTWRYILHMSALRPRTPLQLNINSVRHAEQWKVTCQTHATAVPHNSRQQMPFHCSSKTASQLRDFATLCVTRHARRRHKCVAMCAGM